MGDGTVQCNGTTSAEGDGDCSMLTETTLFDPCRGGRDRQRIDGYLRG
jgi:hypothetical protein